MTPDEGKELFERIKANRNRLDNCSRHLFELGEAPYRLGQKATCQHCGGELGLIEIGAYIRGYMAANGNANDIVPNWS